MIKKGIVKNVQANGTWEGQYGLMYKFEVTISVQLSLSVASL